MNEAGRQERQADTQREGVYPHGKRPVNGHNSHPLLRFFSIPFSAFPNPSISKVNRTVFFPRINLVATNNSNPAPSIQLLIEPFTTSRPATHKRTLPLTRQGVFYRWVTHFNEEAGVAVPEWRVASLLSTIFYFSGVAVLFCKCVVNAPTQFKSHQNS